MKEGRKEGTNVLAVSSLAQNCTAFPRSSSVYKCRYEVPAGSQAVLGNWCLHMNPMQPRPAAPGGLRLVMRKCSYSPYSRASRGQLRRLNGGWVGKGRRRSP